MVVSPRDLTYVVILRCVTTNMDEYLSEIRKDILKRNLVYIRDTLVYNIISSPLIATGVIPGSVQNEIDDSLCNAEKIEKLVLFLIGRPHRINLFMNVLSNPYHGYDFVYENLKDQESEYMGLERTINASNLEVSNSNRNRNEIFRHALMRLSHQNNEESFKKLQSLGLSKWAEIFNNISRVSADKTRSLADLYFLAVDAEIARRRIKFDQNLVSRDWFSEMKNVIPFTANVTQTTMIYLARYGSALSLGGYPFDICVTYLDLAMQLSLTIPTCRETGMVLYIYFNMLSKEYENRPTAKLKNKLLGMAKQAIDHFENDNEETGRDYKRFLIVKIAMLLLGVNMVGKDIPNIRISQEDKRVSKDCLQIIQKPDMWQRMEVRRNMFYYMTSSKMHESENNKHMAIHHLHEAKRFAVRGEFKQEEQNIEAKLIIHQHVSNTCEMIMWSVIALFLYTIYSLISD